MEITGNNPFARVDAYVKNIGREKNRVQEVIYGGAKEEPVGRQGCLILRG